MSKVLDPFRFVLIALAGWMNHRQYQVIDYLREENVFCGSSWAKGGCDSTMISGGDWPSRPKPWDIDCCRK